MIFKAFCVTIACLTAGPTLAAGSKPESAEIVSFFDLIANKNKYDGKLVQLGGFLSFTFEDNSVYYNEIDYSHQFTQNAIWIDTGAANELEFSKYDKKYGYVVGVFSAKECGHLCLYSGGIKFEHFGLMYKDVEK